MGQISEGSIDAQNNAKNLIEVIVGEVMKTVNERTEPHFGSFESLRLQSFGKEEILANVKSEGMSFEELKQQEHQEQGNDICYQNLSEVCTHSSTLSTQGEGDFQPPYVRETKAFYNLGSEGIGGNDQTCIDSSHSSVNTSFTDELITQLHCDINNISFDNINLSDSEVEKELQTKESGYEEESSSQDGEGTKTQVDQSCQTNGRNTFKEDKDSTNDQDNHILRHSPKFSHLDDLLSKYFLLKENYDRRENEEERELLSTSSDECVLPKAKGVAVDNFSQTNPFSNTFLCSNVNSTIALSSDCCESRGSVNESRRTIGFADAEENQESNEWVEANEVQIRITEPGCSKDFLQAENLEEGIDAVQTRQYWSNIGLMTEHIVDRRYMGPVEIPGIESIKGVQRVEEKILTREPEEIIWVTDAETLEEISSLNSGQKLTKSSEVNYLSFPNKTECRKKKKKFASRLTKTISSIFKLNKDSKE